MEYNAVSLFSSSGIGDLGLKANNINTVIACELLPERAKLFQSNYPGATCFCGDIWKLKEKIVEKYQEMYQEPPFMVLATPPCQGMSSNGMGKMISDYRKGLRPKYDERNRLIIPTLEIIHKLNPKWVVFENVPNMNNTMIYDENNELVNIIEYIYRKLGKSYVGRAEVIDVADYGVPQNRRRLITILSNDDQAKKYFKKHGSFLPLFTHDKDGAHGLKPWVTVRDVISDVPWLEARSGKNASKDNPLHKVPLLDDKKYLWVKNTPEGDTAFNNQCINPECGYQGNQRHSARRNKIGINKYSEETPLYCERCGSLLPRPYTVNNDGSIRLMKGYVSAYKRMRWDEPANTLTQNFQFASSDKKLHPSQNRVLSLYEAIILQTISEYPYSFTIHGKMVKDGLIRDTIGESVPPKVMDQICQQIIKIEAGQA